MGRLPAAKMTEGEGKVEATTRVVAEEMKTMTMVVAAVETGAGHGGDGRRRSGTIEGER